MYRLGSVFRVGPVGVAAPGLRAAEAEGRASSCAGACTRRRIAGNSGVWKKEGIIWTND